MPATATDDAQFATQDGLQFGRFFVAAVVVGLRGFRAGKALNPIKKKQGLWRTVEMKKLMIAAALIVASGTANATVFELILAEDGFAVGQSDNAAGNYTLTGNSQAPATDATWTFNDDGGAVTGTGTFTAAIQPFGPGSPIFSHTMMNPTIADGVASALQPTYACINGTFLNLVGSQGCGAYGFGDDGVDDSVFFYDETGRDFTRMILGDDVDNGVDGVQTLATLLDMNVAFNDGVTLVLQTPDWFNDDNGICDDANPCDSAGGQLTFSIVPVPAAVWLFGSALGLLGWIRRRASA